MQYTMRRSDIRRTSRMTCVTARNQHHLQPEGRQANEAATDVRRTSVDQTVRLTKSMRPSNPVENPASRACNQVGKVDATLRSTQRKPRRCSGSSCMTVIELDHIRFVLIQSHSRCRKMQCLNSETWVKAWRWLGESSSSGSSKAIAGSGTRTQPGSHTPRMRQ